MSEEVAVPPRLRKLWRLTTPSRMGRPARMTLDQVVVSALALADADGLAGVTLPKVARRLGVSDMALYRHVESKDELLTILRDAGLGDPPETTGTGPWRVGLHEWAVAQWRIYRRRPWLAQIPITEPPAGPHEIAWMDAALAVLAGARIGWGDKLRVLGLIGGYVRSTILLEQELASGASASGRAATERGYGQALSTLVDPERFPQMAELAAAGLLGTPVASGTDLADEDVEFVRGLTVLLDGVGAMIERARP